MKTIRFVIAIIAACLCACSSSNGSYRNISGSAWGTVYHITYNGAPELADSILAEIEHVNSSLSTFNTRSTLYRLNSGATDTVDSLFVDVFTEAAGIWQVSGGLFDPTVGPLVKLWGFGNLGETPEPDSAAVDSARALVGFDRCRLRDLHLIKDVTNMEIDLAAIAKGYGVDRIALALRRNGCLDYMVEVGGEVAASGVNPDGKPWRIRIDAPGIDQQDAILSLDNECVATSGNYRNYRERADGSRFGHTINPLTGYPATTPVISATIVAPRCATADGLATAAMTMGSVIPVDSIAKNIHATYPYVDIYIVADTDGEPKTHVYPRHRPTAATSL